jgi:hypothetical protein
VVRSGRSARRRGRRLADSARDESRARQRHGDLGGWRHADLQDGLFYRGHTNAPTSIKITKELARKIFIDADAAAGVQAFLAGEMHVEGDLAKLVAMQTVEPSEPQKRLTRQIAAITQ